MRIENKAVWISRFDSKDERLAFISNSEDIALQYAIIYLPKLFTDSNRQILFQDFELPTPSIKHINLFYILLLFLYPSFSFKYIVIRKSIDLNASPCLFSKSEII